MFETCVAKSKIGRSMKQWYEALFDNYAKSYDSECYVQGTVGEVDFIEKELGFDKSKRILDIGCGTGRHAIELAKRGYKVTGVDLSKSQLQRAKEKASDAKVEIEFIRGMRVNWNLKINSIWPLCSVRAGFH